MVKTYETIKLEAGTYRRFKGAKHLYEFQNGNDYTMSQFVDILVDAIGKKLVPYINKLETPKSQSHASEAPRRSA